MACHIAGGTGLRELIEGLRQNSGCAITHVGKVERLDGSPVTQDDAHELFNALHSFLSFARGMWSPPILYVGVDNHGKCIWREWSARQASPWRSVLTWFPEFEPQCLARAFPGFMRLWQDPDRQNILQVAIHWYVEANLNSGGTEGAVILSQNGLERLTYFIMVHERGILTEQDFQPRGLSAAERMRRLLAEFRLPATIGAARLRIQHLPTLATAQGWDAPDAPVTLRNAIIHPDRRNTERLRNYPIPARNEAWILSLWYFELVLLKWFGYTGNYVNRQTIQFNGQTEVVP